MNQLRGKKMKKTIVIYGSKYGATKEYASLIAEELGANLIRHNQVKVSELAHYDLIIYGGGLYRGKMLGVNQVKKALSKLKDKKVMMFAVGSVSEQAHTIKQIKKQNALGEYPVFYFRGALDYPNLTTIDRILINGLKKMISKKPVQELDQNAKEFLEMHGKANNFIEKKNIRPLIIETKKK